MINPSQALQIQRAQTFLISNQSTVQKGNHTKADSFNIDILLESASPDEFDAQLLPGGVMNPDTFRTLQDENLITSRYPDDAREFNNAFIK